MADPTYKKLSELTELAAHPATADYFPFVDASAGATKRVTLANIDKLGLLELTDPDADQIVFWDDSAGAIDWLTAGDGLTITGGSLDVDVLGIEDLTDPGADRVMFWDDSAGILTWLSLGANLEISGTSLVVNMETDTITGSEIADDSIDSNHYVDGSIDTAHIANAQVTPAKTTFISGLGSNAYIYAMHIQANGSPVFNPASWSTSLSGNKFTITHNFGAGVYYSVFCNLALSSALNKNIDFVVTKNTNDIEIYIYADGAAINNAFELLVIRYNAS